MRSTFFAGWLVGLGPKFLDSGSQPSHNGSPRNLHTSLVWGQALKPTFENFSPTLKIGGKPQNCPPFIHIARAFRKRLRDRSSNFKNIKWQWSLNIVYIQSSNPGDYEVTNTRRAALVAILPDNCYPSSFFTYHIRRYIKATKYSHLNVRSRRTVDEHANAQNFRMSYFTVPTSRDGALWVLIVESGFCNSPEFWQSSFYRATLC